MFKIDKKYYFLHTTYEHLRSEGWQYIQLSGKYSGFYTPNEKPTHENQFIYFCHSVEKVKMKQIEEEYYKLTDSHPTVPPTITAPVPTKGKNLDSLIPPTPLKPILDSFKNLPSEIVRELLQKKSETIVEDGEEQEQSESDAESQRRLPVSIVLQETTDAK
jgi:hypothetical protein